MTTSTATPPPGPAILVECPWCDAPIELDRDRDAITCPDCRVRVEMAPPATAPTIGHRLAAAA